MKPGDGMEGYRCGFRVNLGKIWGHHTVRHSAPPRRFRSMPPHNAHSGHNAQSRNNQCHSDRGHPRAQTCGNASSWRDPHAPPMPARDAHGLAPASSHPCHQPQQPTTARPRRSPSDSTRATRTKEWRESCDTWPTHYHRITEKNILPNDSVTALPHVGGSAAL